MRSTLGDDGDTVTFSVRYSDSILGLPPLIDFGAIEVSDTQSRTIYAKAPDA